MELLKLGKLMVKNCMLGSSLLRRNTPQHSPLSLLQHTLLPRRKLQHDHLKGEKKKGLSNNGVITKGRRSCWIQSGSRLC